MSIVEFERLAEVGYILIVDGVLVDLVMAGVNGVAAGLVEKRGVFQFGRRFPAHPRLSLDDRPDPALDGGTAQVVSEVSCFAHFICKI
jgi:hypothetical protein